MVGDWLSSYRCWILFSILCNLVSLPRHTLKLSVVHFKIKKILTNCNQFQ